jgi:hypothetical protein
MDVDIEAQMREMVNGLDVPPADLDTQELLPVFLPSTLFAAGKWCGPVTQLRVPEIGLTWAVLQGGNTMRYMNHQMQAYWDQQGLDWKSLAMANLSRHTENKTGPRMLRRVTGGVFAIAFFFEDGLGPSRLLFRGSLTKLFPQGYRVAIPERSCGFAFGTDLNPEEQSQVDGVIKHCFEHGTVPFVAGSFPADDLQPA